MGKILYLIIGYLLVWRQKGVQNYFLLYFFSDSVWLKWGSVSGADAYEIYVMNPSRSEKNFSLVGEVTSITNGKLDTAFILQTAGMFENGDSISVLVAARNEKKRCEDYKKSLKKKDSKK